MDKNVRTLLIANPVAQSGRGASAVRKAEDALRPVLGAQLDVVTTEAAGHAADLAAELGASYQTVIALGGDGIIHEVANGLMRLQQDQRPVLGVIPVGSGNDYARSLDISEDVAKAVRQNLDAEPVWVDLGCVNGEYFTETLSFGLDAAIALGTMERRKKSGKSGTILYLEEGIDQLLHHLDFHPFHLEAVLPDGTIAVREGRCILVAAQIGPTYGGGFKICPDADLSDGLFDVCVANGPIAKPHATAVFLSAKNGGHTKSKHVEIFRASQLVLRFDDEPKCQVDGEALTGEEYRASVAHNALRVLKAL